MLFAPREAWPRIQIVRACVQPEFLAGEPTARARFTAGAVRRSTDGGEGRAAVDRSRAATREEGHADRAHPARRRPASRRGGARARRARRSFASAELVSERSRARGAGANPVPRPAEPHRGIADGGHGGAGDAPARRRHTDRGHLRAAGGRRGRLADPGGFRRGSREQRCAKRWKLRPRSSSDSRKREQPGCARRTTRPWRFRSSPLSSTRPCGELGTAREREVERAARADPSRCLRLAPARGLAEHAARRAAAHAPREAREPPRARPREDFTRPGARSFGRLVSHEPALPHADAEPGAARRLRAPPLRLRAGDVLGRVRRLRCIAGKGWSCGAAHRRTTPSPSD